MKSVLVGVKMVLDKIQRSVTVCIAIILKDFFTALQNSYVLMCGLEAYENIHKNSSDSVRSGCGIPLP